MKTVNHMYTIANPRDGELDFKLILSIIVVQSCAISIMMLQRTAYLGELIIMLTQMQAELLKFFSTFGILIVMFVFIGRFLSSEIKEESSSYLQIILDLFNALNGN
jgi:cation transport ATPase